MTVAPLLVLLVLGAAPADGSSVFESMPSVEEIQRKIEENGYCWQAGETSVTRMSDEERANLCGLVVPPEVRERMGDQRTIELGDSPRDLPSAWDWREHGGVTPVTHQGNCGSCWDFCAVAAFESMIKIYDEIEYDLSEQQVLSCNTYGFGCGGGWMEAAYELFINPGAVLEECMPYQANDQIPCTQYSCTFVGQIDGYSPVAWSVAGMKQVIYEQGPIAVAMAVLPDFGGYTGGCYQNDDPGEINHGVLCIGWDDSMCSYQGAWIAKNSWGTGWGDGGFFYIRYGDCQFGYGGDVIEYTPQVPNPRLEYVSCEIDDSAGNGNGIADPGEAVLMSVTVENTGTLAATGVSGSLSTTTAGVAITDDTASFPDIDPGTTGATLAPHFAFEVDAGVASCTAIDFQLALSSSEGLWDREFTVTVGRPQTFFYDELEEEGDWVAGDPGDNATSGLWARLNPNGTYDEYGHLVQPEDDHTPSPGVKCFITGNAFAGQGPGANDVDGGKTTLFSPVFDLSAYDGAVVSYYRWYTNDTGANPETDWWVVDVTDDGWATCQNLENVGTSARSWLRMEFHLNDYIDMTDQVQFRFIASDYEPGSIVEAGVDDFTLLACTGSDSEPPEVTVISPNGGEVWMPSSTHEITWSAWDNVAIDYIEIYLSRDGGESYDYTIALGEENDGTYDWVVTEPMTAQAKMKVVAYDTSLLDGSDESDDVFTIGPETGVDDEELPRVMALHQSSPNPFTPSAVIAYALPVQAAVTLRVYDLSGRMVRELVNDHQQPGRYTMSWDGKDERGIRASSGVYFCRLVASGQELTRKMVLVE